MKCTILTIGNEIVQGFILNTNAQFFAQKLTQRGYSIQEVVSILDGEQQIISTIKRIKNDNDIIIISGGLGPTEDDKTKQAIAKALDLKLEIDEYELIKIKEHFKNKGIEYHSMNDKQALYSKLDNILINNNGTANGYYFLKDNVTYCVLPGPPRENRVMFDEFLATLENDTCHEKSLYLTNINETKAETLAADLYTDYPNVNIGCYLQPHGLVYRFNSNEINNLDECFSNAKKIFAEFIVCEDFDLIKSFVDYLIKNNISISFAESCTAGLACSLIANIEGVSQILSESFITYSYDAKEKYLGIKKETLEKYSAVSSECVLEMILGLAKQTNSDLNIAISGYAGPGGKEDGKLFVGVKYKDVIDIREYYYPMQRNDFRLKAAYLAIIQAYLVIKNV